MPEQPTKSAVRKVFENLLALYLVITFVAPLAGFTALYVLSKESTHLLRLVARELDKPKPDTVSLNANLDDAWILIDLGRDAQAAGLIIGALALAAALFAERSRKNA